MATPTIYYNADLSNKSPSPHTNIHILTCIYNTNTTTTQNITPKPLDSYYHNVYMKSIKQTKTIKHNVNLSAGWHHYAPI